MPGTTKEVLMLVTWLAGPLMRMVAMIEAAGASSFHVQLSGHKLFSLQLHMLEDECAAASAAAWHPRGVLIAHLAEHKRSVNRLAVLQVRLTPPWYHALPLMFWI